MRCRMDERYFLSVVCSSTGGTPNAVLFVELFVYKDKNVISTLHINITKGFFALYLVLFKKYNLLTEGFPKY